MNTTVSELFRQVRRDRLGVRLAHIERDIRAALRCARNVGDTETAGALETARMALEHTR